MLGMLAEHQVRYAIVGGVGARLQGTPYVTGDSDLVPDPDPDNLARLATALSDSATLKKSANSTEYLPHPEVQPAEFYAEYFAMYRTRYGAIDVLIELPGVGPFDAIMQNARRYDITDGQSGRRRRATRGGDEHGCEGGGNVCPPTPWTATVACWTSRQGRRSRGPRLRAAGDRRPLA
jgi:hypothetical protein